MANIDNTADFPRFPTPVYLKIIFRQWLWRTPETHAPCLDEIRRFGTGEYMWAGAAAKTLIPKISEIEGKHRLIPSDFYTKQVYSSGQLSCTDVFSGLNLQNKVRNERPHKVLPVARVQKRHVYHTDIYADFFREL